MTLPSWASVADARNGLAMVDGDKTSNLAAELGDTAGLRRTVLNMVRGPGMNSYTHTGLPDGSSTLREPQVAVAG
eukprot:SM000285S10810  [mRNA]  locus=s285:135489:135971:- [translate_table: standard]